MKCIYCGGVLEAYGTVTKGKKIEYIRRRRKCLSCGKRITTIEIINFKKDKIGRAENKGFVNNIFLKDRKMKSLESKLKRMEREHKEEIKNLLKRKELVNNDFFDINNEKKKLGENYIEVFPS